MSLSDRTDFDDVSAEVAENVDEVCDRFEREWKAGTAPRIEEFLDEVAFEEREVLLQELVRVELAYRHKLGQTIAEEEYLTRFPSLNAEWLKRATVRSKPKRESLTGVLGDFQLQYEIGRGGMGVVYAAIQISLGRRVAVKVLPSSAMMDSRQLRRFQNESRAAASLHHPHIVPVYAVGSDRGVNFFAMQLIEGQTLSQRIKSFGGSSEHTRMILSQTDSESNTVSNPTLVASVATQSICDPVLLTPQHYREVAKQGIQVAEALEHAHSLGVVHRDIKPSNLIVDRAEKLWVTDFGLARIATDTSMTISGDMLGTLRYMSPEQALAKHGLVDHRTDIYSLGVTLYELLTLRPAIDGKDRGEILQKIAFEEPPAPRKLNPKIPLDLETIVLKAIAKEPHLRYQTAEELADDLRRFTEDQPIKARRRTAWQSFARWQRRNQALSAALTMSLAVIVMANAIVTWKWREERRANLEARLAEQSAKRSERLAREAEAFAKRAELQATQRADELQQSVYLQRVARSEQEWWSNNVGRAEQILDRCPPELRHWEWGYLKRLCSSAARTFDAQDGEVSAVAYSPDGRQIASGGESKRIHLWDTVTGQEKILSGHTSIIQSLRFSPDGKRLASAASSWTLYQPGEVKVWDAVTGEEMANFPTAKGTNVSALAFSPDGRTLALAVWNHTIQLVDLETKAVRVLSGYGSSVKAVVFTPNGKTIVAGGWNGKVMAWDVESGKIQKTLTGHSGDVMSLSFHPSGKYLASSSWDSTVRVWDFSLPTADTKPVILTDQHKIVGEVSFSPDGTQLASCSDDGTIVVRQTGSWKSGETIRGHDGVIRTIAFSPGSRGLVSGSWDGNVKLWDLTRSQLGTVSYGHKGQYRQLVFRPDGSRMILAAQPIPVYGGDSVLTSHDPLTGKQLSVIDRHPKGFRTVAIDPANRFIAANWGHDVRLWDAESEKRLRELTGLNSDVTAVAAMPEGLVVAGAENGSVMVWKADTGEQVHSVDSTVGPVTAIAARSTGGLFVVGGADGRMAAWHLAESGLMEQKALRLDVGSPIRCLASSPTDSILAASCDDGTVRLWDFDTGAERHVLKGHIGTVNSVSFSADGHRFASSGKDGTVVLWDTKSGQEALALRRQFRDLNSATFSPRGDSLVAVANLTNEIRIWNSAPQTADDKALKMKTWRLAEAASLAAQRQWSDAESHLNLVLETTPDDRIALFRRGNVLAEQHSFDSAKQDFQRMLELSSDQPLDETILTGYWYQCLLQVESGDEAGYRQTCLEISKRFSEVHDPHLAGWCGVSFVLSNDRDHVAPCVKMMEAFAPTNINQAFYRGLLLFISGDAAKSAESFVLATKLPRSTQTESIYDWLTSALVNAQTPAVSIESLLKSRAWQQKGAPFFSWHQRMEFNHLQRLAEQIVTNPKFHEALRNLPRDQRLATIQKLSQDIANKTALVPNLRNRGNLYAEMEQWTEAVADFAQMCELAPTDMDSWYRRAAANLGANDIAEHSRVVTEMLKLFGSTKSIGIASSMMYVATTNPNPPGDREQLLLLAELGTKAFAGNERLVAAMKYRNGDFYGAVESFEVAAPKFAPRAWDWCFLAMSHQQLGDEAAAGANLKLCDEWIAEAESQWKSGQATSKKRWFNWQERAEVLHLRREAQSLFESNKAAN